MKPEILPWITRERIIVMITTLALSATSAGWLLYPAKDRDLQELRVIVVASGQRMDALAAKIESSVDRLSVKLDKLQDGQQANREEIIRLSVAAKTTPPPVATATPAPVAVPGKAAKPGKTSVAAPRQPRRAKAVPPVHQAQQTPQPPTERPNFLQRMLQ